MNDQFLLEEEKEFRRKYRLSVWWVEHRTQLKSLLIGACFVVEGVVLTAVVWTYVDTLLIGGEAERVSVVRMAVAGRELHEYTTATAAEDLTFSAVSVLPTTAGVYDMAVTVTNPNDDWWAEGTYVFRAGDLKTEEQKVFILPSQVRPVFALNTPSASAPRGATVEWTSLVWHRVDKHVTGPYTAFAQDHLAFSIVDPVFTDITVEEKSLGRVSFTVQNNTAFSYYDVQFAIVLRRAGAIVGVNTTTISSVMAGQSQQVEVNWFGPLPTASEVLVYPLVNIFDDRVYQTIPGASTTDTRRS